jgi:predicted dehydrogenase
VKQVARREFIKGSLAAGLSFGLPSLAAAGPPHAPASGPNSEIRLAVIGLGGIGTVGGVGGRGRQLVSRFREVPGVRVAALCDVDQAILDHEVRPFKDRHEDVAVYTDLRKVFDDNTIDAVAIAAPNHWHALATIWACQAGKDVYVEKPFCYNIWEGRQMVAAARKYGRIVQVGTQRRSSEVLRQAMECLHSGQLGAIRSAHALVYRAREAIGKVAAPIAPPASVDYDLWCGPAPRAPLRRKQLHYDWHWFWSTGNGEIGNNGAHQIDVCRWALGQTGPAPRAMSIGGRFAFDDDGETANTQIAILDYQPAPLICEIRNLHTAKGAAAMGKFRNSSGGVVIECVGGYLAGDAGGAALFDNQGRKIKEIRGARKPQEMEVAHAANFVAAVRSRKVADLHAEAAVGYVSATLCHMANASYRLGKQTAPEAIRAALQSSGELSDAYQRCAEYLRNNGVDLAATPAVLGPWLTLDADQGRFVGAFAEQANALGERAYREPFAVPKIT